MALVAEASSVQYEAVKVLMLSWEGSAQEDLVKQLEDLSAEFKLYLFDVEIYRIEREKSHQRLNQRLQRFLEYDRKGTLLIVYYGGHGLNNGDKNNIWLLHDPDTITYSQNPKVNWSSLQSLFLDDCESHVLFLLDCCFAASAVQCTHGNSAVEAIVAAGVDRVAPRHEKDSFTSCLTAILQECRMKGDGGIYAARLCACIGSRLNQTDTNSDKGTSKRVTPHHLPYSNAASNIKLYPLRTAQRSTKVSQCASLQGPEPFGDEQSTHERTRDKPFRLENEEDHRRSEKLPNVRKRSATDGSLSLIVAMTSSGSQQIQIQKQNQASPVRPSKKVKGNNPFFPSEGDRGSSRAYKRCPFDSLRILRLHPSANISDPIICSLMIQRRELPASKKQPYFALSHIWGPDEGHLSQVQIQLGEGEPVDYLSIRPNLDLALRRLRQKSEQVYIWVDWLCIDRENDIELRYQNSIMHEIFQNAAKVFIWLGEGDADSKTAMHFISKLIDLDQFDTLLTDSETPGRCHALVKLLEGSYFSRRWIFQDLMLAEQAVVCSGEDQVSWHEFRDAILLLGSRFEKIQYLCKRAVICANAENKMHDLADIRALSAYVVAEASRDLFLHSAPGAASSACTLQTLVCTLSTLQTAIPQDFIFALLPLASDKRACNITRNYDVPLSDLFQKFVQYCTKSQSLDIICTPWAPIINNTTWPSWICRVDRLPFGKFKRNIYGRRNGEVFVGLPHKPLYNASRGSSATPIFGTTSPDGQVVFNATMVVTGFQIGTIARLSNHASGGTLHEDWISMSGWETWQKWVPDDFWRTLIADREPSGSPARPSYHRACLYWLDYFQGEDVSYDVLQHRRHPSFAIEYIQRVQSVIWNRRLFTYNKVLDKAGIQREVEEQRFGLAPHGAKVGDTVAILHGCSVPVILRRQGDGWILIGESFVYGMMKGEAMREENMRRTQEFLLR